MISRLTRETAGGVLSFTFLDVLTCTMGSLVLLVVVLGEKAADTRLEDALRAGPRATPQSAPAEQPPELATPASISAGDAAATLAALQERQAKLDELRKRASERLDEETARLSHLEEHERRLEHEIGQLYITLQRLEEAETQHTVDKATAERELVRLKQLISDTEKELADLRSQSPTNKSYAIVPYEGRSGTHRRPIYIECTAESIVIQPEGVKFLPWDFMGPLRSGNPLASALRAAREELNQRARAAGEQELPEAYPLILVRPNGGHTYRMVVTAVESWDVQFGYEMVDADWELTFPEPDPKLAEVMAHAVDKARQRQSQLAKAAPRTYGAIPSMPSTSGPDASTGSGFNRAVLTSGGSAPAPSSRGERELSFAEEVAARSEETRYGEIAPESGSANGSVPVGVASGSNSGAASGDNSSASVQTQLAGGGAPAGSMSALTSTPTPDVHQLPKEKNASLESRQEPSEEPTESAAATRGANWANGGARRKASPITRPIRVLVGAQQIDVPDSDNPSASVSITLDQPTSKVLDDLASAVTRHTDSWGLAGASMYWRPTLVIEVAPGAERHAIRLRDLMRDSGLDVRFKETEAAARSEELPDATR